MTHVDKFAIFSDAHHGFRKRFCESQLVTTIQDLAKGLDDKAVSKFCSGLKHFSVIVHKEYMYVNTCQGNIRLP